MDKTINNIIKNVINEYIDTKSKKLITENNNNITLYRCFDNELENNNDFIWLSTTPDNGYGKFTAEFSIPINKLKLADKETTINYIKKYDIKNFNDAINDEYIDRGMDFFDWNAYKNGKISDQKAYDSIPYLSWAEVMEHPEYYNFPDKMKEDNFDGYYFDYIESYFSINTYYLIFNKQKVLKYIV